MGKKKSDFYVPFEHAPRNSFQMQVVKSLWTYRGFVLGSVKREFRSRYRNSLLGPLWAFIQPMAMIVVYAVVFSQVMHTRLPGVDSSFGYSIFLCSGILTWGLFADITSRSQSMFLDNAGLLKKINFPGLCLPVVVVLNAILNFSIVFGLFTLFLLVSDNFPGTTYLALLPLLLILLAFATGLGMVLGVVNVFFRDVGQLFTIALQFGFWLTPVVYPLDVLPQVAQRLMQLNPLAPLMVGFQTSMVARQWPDWGSLVYPAVLAGALCWLGQRLFCNLASDMLDEL